MSFLPNGPVVGVNFVSDGNFGDGDLELIRPLKGIKTLFLHGNNVTDHGMEVVSGFSELNLLLMQGCRVTDQGLMQLSKLPIESLTIVEMEITDGGMKRLGQLAQINCLALVRCMSTESIFRFEPGFHKVTQLGPIVRMKPVSIV